MITIKKTIRSIPFSTNSYKNKAQKILDFLGYKDFDLGIWLTTDKTIQKYNHQFRHKNKATDILSFPYHPDLKAGEKIVPKTDDDKNLGDLIIALPYVWTNKHELEGTFEQRMDRMLVHGICHLLGHDHVDDSEFKTMLTLENKLLKIIS